MAVAPERRTIVVLAALVMGMTLTSGLLLLLAPGPVAPVSGITLTSVDRGGEPGDRLFDTAEPRRWRAIVIHDSGSLAGSSKTIGRAHASAGHSGLGYHFVVNNGTGEEDGLIEMGFRWQHQSDGDYVQGSGAQWFNQNAIGICLVGDADRKPFTPDQRRELVWLVQELQNRFSIPREAVYVEVGSSQQAPPKLFPYTWFRSQLLTARAN